MSLLRIVARLHVTTDKILHLDLILIDSKGNEFWVHIPPLLIETFQKQLNEQEVFISQDIKITRTTATYRPIANYLIIQFFRDTTAEHVSNIPSIPPYKFKFTFTQACQMGDKVEQRTIRCCWPANGIL